jgi:tetratricopeptide (TPR) repeat protein
MLPVTEDARQEIRLAIALDPLSPMFIVDVGITYLYTRQFREAIEQGEKALAMEKDYPYARGMLGSAYWYQGKIEDALAVGWPNPNRPERNHFAKQIYERGGIAALNLAMRTDVEQRNPSGSFDARSAEVALWYAITGDKEKTFAWLEKAYQERDPWLPLDLAKPPFDRFRSEQGFHNLLRRIGLPQ